MSLLHRSGPAYSRSQIRPPPPGGAGQCRPAPQGRCAGRTRTGLRQQVSTETRLLLAGWRMPGRRAPEDSPRSGSRGPKRRAEWHDRLAPDASLRGATRPAHSTQAEAPRKGLGPRSSAPPGVRPRGVVHGLLREAPRVGDPALVQAGTVASGPDSGPSRLARVLRDDGLPTRAGRPAEPAAKCPRQPDRQIRGCPRAATSTSTAVPAPFGELTRKGPRASSNRGRTADALHRAPSGALTPGLRAPGLVPTGAGLTLERGDRKSVV